MLLNKCVNLDANQENTSFCDNADIDIYTNNMHGSYDILIDKYMPKTKLSRREKKFNEKPWITKGLKISIAKKNELYKQSKLDPLKITEYKTYSNLLIKLKTKAHDDFDKKRISDHGHNKRKVWQIINERINRKKRQRTSIKCIRNKNDQLLREPLDVANCINDHFSSIGKSMANEFTSDTPEVKNPLDYIPKRVRDSLFLFDTNISELINLIIVQDPNKGHSFDLISNKIIQKTQDIIAPFLLILFNNCLRNVFFQHVSKLLKLLHFIRG